VAGVPSALAEALSDRYLLERELGQGGMATVYLAHDLKHDRDVALKVLHPDLAAALGPERFQREIRLAARLQHPHILPVFDSGEANDGSGRRLWFTMPYVEGESLRDRLIRERQLPVADAVRFVSQAAAALDYAHRQGIVHRDIKPENILLTQHDGQVLIADFGIARGAGGDQSLTQAGVTLGTPAYMSPEQASGGGEIDGRSDIYSLGCVAYEMLAGEPPFTGPSAQAVIAKRFTETPARLESRRPGLPPPIADAVARALSREPSDRFLTAGDLTRALELSALPRARKVPWRRIGVAAGVALTVALGAWALRRNVAAAPTRSRTTLAVLPFTVRGSPALAYMREGMVELLSTKLDGAGELRAVDPRAVLSALRRQTTEVGPDDGSATARRFGAGRFILGSVLQMGDTLRLDAALYDADGVRQASAQAEVRENELGRGVDDLARLLLGRLSSGTGDRLTSLGAVTTSSYPALRAYLEGQQAFRALNLDSAITAFQQAVALDSTFALAWYRLATAAAWTLREDLFDGASAQAVRHSNRLSVSDRALLEALRTWQSGRLADAEQQYRAIVEAHPDEAETALVRAVELDSADWQARGHLKWLRRRLGQLDQARALDLPRDTASSSYPFERPDAPQAAKLQERVLKSSESAPPERLHLDALSMFQEGFDAPGRRLTRALADPSRPPGWRAHAHLLLATLQLERGRWGAAESELVVAEQLAPDEGLPYRALFALSSSVLAPDSTLHRLAARLRVWAAGRVPDQAGSKIFVLGALNGSRVIVRHYLLGLLELRLGDPTGALAQADSLAGIQDSETEGSLAWDCAATIRAIAAFDKGDPAAALGELERQRLVILDYRFVWPFHSHTVARMLRATALTRLGRDREALVWVEGLTHPEFPLLHRALVAQALRQEGEIYERLGERAHAAEAYGKFIQLWADGDPAAQAQVKAARERVGTLASEPRS
jgi:eukaryotic-like serine/threonine-protein kinase